MVRPVKIRQKDREGVNYKNQILSTGQVDNVCAKFGCSKKLSLMENLCGKYCINHVGEKPVDITKIIKL